MSGTIDARLTARFWRMRSCGEHTLTGTAAFSPPNTVSILPVIQGEAVSNQRSLAALRRLMPAVVVLSTLALGGVAHAAEFKGTSGNDRLWGSPHKDTIHAVAGDDRVHALGGGDFVIGDQGSDVLFGGDGPDHMYGADGNDKVLGERGDDRLRGGAGSDTLLGGAGNDEVSLTLGLGRDHLSGGKGNDVLTSGGDGGTRDVIHCGPGYDAVYSDHFDVFAGGSPGAAGCEELHLLP